MAWYKAIFLDSKGYFYPGETIAGHITVTLRNEIEFRKLSLEYLGEARCQWNEGTGERDDIYYGSQTYFREKTILLSPHSSLNETMRLGPGDFTYPFNFKLPIELPPSFQLASSDTGYVRYVMNIAFDVEDSKLRLQLKDELPFKVLPPPTDLNQTAHLLEPAEIVKEKYLCCLCCQSGPITIKCQINKQEFNIGEPIMFNFELDNKATDQELRKVEARLVEEVILINATSKRRKNQKTVSSVVITQGLQGGAEQSWQSLQLSVPMETVPSFVNCKCVHVSYMFVVEVDIPSAIDTKLEFPITIVNNIQSLQPISSNGYHQPFGIPAPVGQTLQPSVDQTVYPPSPPVGQTVYPPSPVTMQPGIHMNWTPTQPPPPYQG